MQDQSGNGILEEFRIEFLDCWQRLPNKGFFLTLLVVWLGLFHLLGSSTLGYVRTTSLLAWMYNAFTAGGGLLEADEGYGVLVPLVVVVLFWLKRRELMAQELRGWWPGLLLVVLGLSLHVLGYLVQQPRLSVFGMFTGIYGLTGMAWGWGWMRASFFPFFLFVFCVPVGSLAGFVTFPLRLLVTRLVELICHFILSIDVIREGTILKDATGHYQYEVAAACSGIRSLVAIVALGVILGFFSFKKWWQRLTMVAAAFPLAVVGNLLRMLAIVIAAEYGGQSAGNKVHEGGPLGLYSLLPYVPAFFGLLWLEQYLRGKPARPADPPPMEVKTT